MPVSKATKDKSDQTKEHVRLRRFGDHGVYGLARCLIGGRLYVRSGIYHVDRNKARELLSSGHFERIHPDDLEAAKKEAKRSRGTDLQAARENERRRARKRPSRAAYGEAQHADEGDDDILGGDDAEDAVSV